MGTRGAVALGRIPVEGSLEATERERTSLSWRLDDQRLIGVESYVDTTYRRDRRKRNSCHCSVGCYRL